MKLLRQLVWLATVGSSLLNLPARAQPAAEPVPVRVELLAPSGCPSADDFLNWLAERVAVRAAGADETAPTLQVRVSRSGSDYAGELGTASTGGVEAREVVAASCEEVLRALALTAALGIEAGVAAQESRSDPEPEPKAPEPAPKAPPRALARQVAPPSPATPPPPHSAGVSLGAGAWLNAVALPVLAGPAVAIEGRALPTALAVRLRGVHLRELADSSSRTELSLSLGALDMCPIAVVAGPALFWPCASVEAGAARARGQGLSVERTSTLVYGAAGVTTRLELALGSGLAVELDASALGVWSRPRFTVGPDEKTAESTRDFAVGAGLFAAYRFQ